MTPSDLISILPVLILVVWALVLLLVDLWTSKRWPAVTPVLAVVGLAASLAIVLLPISQRGPAFGGMLCVDGFSQFLCILFATTGILSIGLAYRYLSRITVHRGEYFVLLVFSISGMMLMSMAGDLIVIFLSLELLSIPLYILAGMAQQRIESKEASLKYFLLGTFASAFVLFGISLIFGAAETTNLYAIAEAVKAGSINSVLFIIGSALLLAGFGFKVAAVPFHTWTPDVYQGSPSPVTAFMAVGAKAAGFAALIRVFSLDFGGLSVQLTPVFWVLAALTMFVGNVVAVAQKDLKRMLAYSSIAHAGYLLMAFVSFGNSQVNLDSVASALFYLTAYAVTSLGAWAVLISVEREDGSGTEIEDLAGMGRRSSWLAGAMTVFMLSFTGIPLTLGFWGKFYLFRTAIQGGFIELAIIGLLTSLVSAFYYLRVIVKMYFQDGEAVIEKSKWVHAIAIICAIATVALAFIPGLLFGLAGGGNIAGL